jgi:hypothetical protein
MNLEKDAHKYLVDKGCLSMGQKYTAIEVQKMLVDFTEEQVKLYSQTPVSGRSELFFCVNSKSDGSKCKEQCNSCNAYIDKYPWKQKNCH